MAVRIRINGIIICAAKCDPLPDDIYICDGLHYRLSVLEKVLIPDVDEDKNGLWYWKSQCFIKADGGWFD